MAYDLLVTMAVQDDIEDALIYNCKIPSDPQSRLGFFLLIGWILLTHFSFPLPASGGGSPILPALTTAFPTPPLGAMEKTVDNTWLVAAGLRPAGQPGRNR